MDNSFIIFIFIEDRDHRFIIFQYININFTSISGTGIIGLLYFNIYNKYILFTSISGRTGIKGLLYFNISIYINKYICYIHLMEDRDHRFIIFEYTNIYVTYISARIGIICLLFLNISISILHKSQQGSYHSFMIFQYINMYDTFDSRTIGIIGLLYFNISI